MSLVLHHWADLQSVEGFPGYDNIAPNAKCQRVLVLAHVPGLACLITASRGNAVFIENVLRRGIWCERTLRLSI